MLIREDDLIGPEISELLKLHLDYVAADAPPESVHALDLKELRALEVTFRSAWDEETLLGCGALKELDPGHGEIKSMHTAESYRGKGIAAFILEHIIAVARKRSYQRLSLETGSSENFVTARALYERYDFETCPPFADYQEDPLSTFMALRF